MLELVRRAALVLLWAGVFIQCTFGLLPAERLHTARSTPPRSPARPWALEARHIRRYGRRVVALRVQLVAVSIA